MFFSGTLISKDQRVADKNYVSSALSAANDALSWIASAIQEIVI